MKLLPVTVCIHRCITASSKARRLSSACQMVASAKDVMFSSAFVCLLCVSRIMQKKITQPVFTKFGEKVARGLWKNPLDSVDNKDHFRVRLRLLLGRAEAYEAGDSGPC